MTTESGPFDVAIIGAGFAGLCAAIKLLDAGLGKVTVFERADQVGGTWRENTYPGCACDIQSHLYSFSFARNPNWSRAYPEQQEIQEYLVRCVERFRLREHIRFNTAISEAQYDATTATWRLTSEAGAAFSARILINATGPLSQPRIPNIPGRERFHGASFHSAKWDHTTTLAGKRVGVVGTGASAIQFVPEIALCAEQVVVFQRTPAWVLPREDRAFTAKERRRFRRFPFLSRLQRARIYLRQELLAFGFLFDGKIASRIRAGARSFLRASVSDPVLREKITPDYRPGCKRLLISNDWYPTLQRDNVHLETAEIESIDPTGVIANGIHYDVDVLIYGTGFRATDFLAPMRVYGTDGVELTTRWAEGATTHLGLVVPGFPNLFLLVGPNTGLGHNSIVFMIECQVRYVVNALKRIRQKHKRSVAVSTGAAQASYASVQQRLKRTVWLSGCKSWYLDERGRNNTLWPGFTLEYWWRTRRFDANNYEFE